MEQRPKPRFVSRHGPSLNVLALVLAGGEGKRLWPLTQDRAKPAVPMGGRYRLVDFVLSNFVNSGYHKIKVLTQYKSDSLNNHLVRGWRLSTMLDQYVEPVPAQQRRGKDWFRGSADAIYQSLNVITDEDPDIVCVFGGDHIYKMDVRQVIEHHLECGAEMTVTAIPVPASESIHFGVIEVDAAGRMVGFQEKPREPKEMPGRPGWVLASMGNYVWNRASLIDEIRRDASEDTAHDFGRNILTSMVGRTHVQVYDFSTNEIPGAEERERGYWRDVGTIGAYFEANMDLVQVSPVFDLYNPRWPLRTWARPLPPAKFVFADEANARIGLATDSLVSDGCIISGGRIDRSILGPQVRVNSFSHVEECIVFEDVEIGRHARVRRAIIDKNVKIPPGAEIGYDLDADRKRFHVSEEGIVVVPKEYRFS